MILSVAIRTESDRRAKLKAISAYRRPRRRGGHPGMRRGSLLLWNMR